MMDRFCFNYATFVLFEISTVHNLIWELVIGELNDQNRSRLNLKLVGFECFLYSPSL